MKLGDTITLAGSEWTVRPFTAAEHQRWDELAEERDLHGKAAALQAAQAARAGTARQMLIESQARAIQAKLNAYLEGEDLRPDLTEEEQLAAFALATELDMLSDKLNAIQTEQVAATLLLEEELTQARDAVTASFMHRVTASASTFEEFAAALTPAETLVLDELVVLGKLRAGLSARNRREAAMIDKYLSRLNGSDSESPPQPPAARQKPGRGGRSKKSSSRSKGGASAPSNQPAQ